MVTVFRGLVISLAITIPLNAAAEKPASPKSPIQAKDSLAHFELVPGLKIEAVASEPEVIDPVAIRFDEDGRMWVVEMRDYPHGPAAGEKPKSRIKILEDKDNDGNYETVKIFADELLFATGLQPWKGGAFVTMAGQVAYMKDTTGDGRADQVETWYTGFAQENTQLRANHPRLALDNHIYIANGLRGGTVVDARDPDSKPVSISGMDFRFDPMTHKFEPVSGVGQFGLTFDDWGNRFVCSNRNPVKHIVIENRYLKKNPLAAVPAIFNDVAIAGAASRIYPIARAWTTSNLHAGQFTAACGVDIFRGDALPDEFYGNAFTCDPTGHLVHREIMKPAGATFTAKPAREGVEFLASRDQWFRPVNLRTGPDGALYVVDMYRAVIEHPQFMPTELKTRRDLLLGNNRGRIYRITSKDSAKKPATPQLSKASSEQLVQHLENTNAWWRETSARLLLERQDKSAETSLRNTARRGKLAAARLQALWLLRGLGAESEDDVLEAMKDGEPRVRRQGVLMAEHWLDKNPDRLNDILSLAGDTDTGVQFQVALSITPLPETYNKIFHGMQVLLFASVKDDWLRHAVIIAAGDNAGSWGNLFAQTSNWSDKPGAQLLLTDLFAAAGKNRDEKELRRTLEFLSKDYDEQVAHTQRAVITAFGQSLLGQRKSLQSLLDKSGDDVEAGILTHFERAAVLAGNKKSPDNERIEAIQLLALHTDANILGVLAQDQTSQAVRIAAIDALRRHAGLEPWQALIKSFPSESPAIRGPILDGLLARADRTTLLLDEIEAENIKPGELDGSRTNRLLNHGNAEIKNRATKLLASAIPADRVQTLADYQAVLKLKGEPIHGRQVFKANCAQCHRIGDLGVDVAPNISDSRTKQPTQYLTDIIQPNRAIDANYVAYVVITTDGRILTGVLANETSTSITLRQPENKSITLSRGEIDEMRSTGISLMPEGLEKKIPHQDMADLISFIKNWRYLDGKIPFKE